MRSENATRPTYAELLKDPRWQRKRLEILNRDDWTCQRCGAEDKTLHVHHRKYGRGFPWEIENGFLVTLCEACHEKTTEVGRRLAELISCSDPSDLEEVAGLLEAKLTRYGKGASILVRDYEHAEGIGHEYFLTAEEVLALAAPTEYMVTVEALKRAFHAVGCPELHRRNREADFYRAYGSSSMAVVLKAD